MHNKCMGLYGNLARAAYITMASSEVWYNAVDLFRGEQSGSVV